MRAAAPSGPPLHDCNRRIDEPHDYGCPTAEYEKFEDGLQDDDVFIVEGQLERYGRENAWAVCR